MKSAEILREIFRMPQIAEDCNIFNFNECETCKEFNNQFYSFFGETVCEIITSKSINELAKKSAAYVYGYSGQHILGGMPDIILILYSNDNKENGKCIFLWRIDD